MSYKNNNLTNLYRPSNLNEVIGQENNIRFLKNSLYKEIIYPLYLFSGIRGTGKTSTARIFALSFLCENYHSFIKNINTIIPCYKCSSCSTFLEKLHPDIIELDAASNNGIDTIRSIIDNAYLAPIIGKKKFYIIDEVHMLSKAAFNACLKIMEEPPEHVCFILATTELNKIIETIRSRSIILNFKSVENKVLYDYLNLLCKKENITIEENALNFIIDISDGSVRDSLNYIERLRINNEYITVQLAENILGKSNKLFCEEFIDCLIFKDIEKYKLFQESFKNSYKCQKQFWLMTVNILQKKKFTNENFIILKLFYEFEEKFFHTINLNGLLDIIFYTFINNIEPYNNTIINNDNNNNINVANTIITNKTIIHNVKKAEIKDEKIINKYDPLKNFLNAAIEKEKILGAIFQQGKLTYDSEKNIIHCSLRKMFNFYKDFLAEKNSILNNLIKLFFNSETKFNLIFTDENNKENDYFKINNNLPFDKSNVNKNNNNIINNLPKDNFDIDKENIKSTYKAYNSIYKKNEKRKVNSDNKGILAKKINELIPGITYYTEIDNEYK